MVGEAHSGPRLDKEPAVLAAVVHQFKAPLQLEEVPLPEPGLGEVLIRVEAAGLCHTDIHAAHGDWPVKPKLPLIPGHEGVGIVTALGPGVREVAEGDRVAIPWLGWACGACERCASGWETLCGGQQRTGYSVDGSYAQYVKASARYVGHVPEGMDPFEAAPLTCAGVTTSKAVKQAQARPSDLVAVYGIGGWAISLCSTPRSPGPRWPRSTWSTTSSPWPGSWGPTM
jgi:alcohol dehydrogenase, propanol-preferring